MDTPVSLMSFSGKMCKKKAAFSDGLKSREETPNKAYAA